MTHSNLQTVRNFVASKYPGASYWGIYSNKYTFVAGGIFVQISLETGVVRRSRKGVPLAELKVAL